DFLWNKARKGSLNALPSRVGMLWHFSERHLGNRLGMQGIYLQEGLRYTRISISPDWAISPTGCRLIVSRVGGFEVIELCKESEK
ncbi:MAG TPA: hypothetical protein VI279_10315, partial [Rhodocyclaceae bacterium]